MIITRTPFRISFAGGGTDLRAFYSEEPGCVISSSINKYIYVVIKKQIGIVEYKYRINWSKVEFRNHLDEIEHPIVRETLRLFEIDFPIEITTFTDIPGSTGLGSSSAFAVGLIHALHALKGEMVTKHMIASQAANIEVNILGRSMGKQDHYASAYGDLNVFTFTSNELVKVEPVPYKYEAKKSIENNLMLYYLNIKRNASKILETQKKETKNKFVELKKLKSFVNPIRKIFSTGHKINSLGNYLHKGWLIKRNLTDDISSNEIDYYYDKAIKAGAVGGKLLGAGGGGFFFFLAPPYQHEQIRQALPQIKVWVPFKIDHAGSQVIFYNGT